MRDFHEVEQWKKMVRTSRNSQGMDELEFKVSRLRDGVSKADLCTIKEFESPEGCVKPLCWFTCWIRPP